MNSDGSAVRQLTDTGAQKLVASLATSAVIVNASWRVFQSSSKMSEFKMKSTDLFTLMLGVLPILLVTAPLQHLRLLRHPCRRRRLCNGDAHACIRNASVHRKFMHLDYRARRHSPCQ
jgi:hypothetical protein